LHHESNPICVHAVDVLKEGIIWRVGNGQGIDIWEDPWLPREVTRRPITPKGRTLLRKVADLIDPVSDKWDDQLLNQTFWEEDVKIIKSIPIHVEMGDMIAWHFDKKGRFSVKSAYRVHRDAILRHKQEANQVEQVQAEVMILFGESYGRLTVIQRSNIFYGGCVIIHWR
jgi:hypothetical protein